MTKYAATLDMLRTDGWAKGAGHQGTARCLRVALNESGVWNPGEARQVICEQYPDRLADPAARIFEQFNDHPDTVFADLEGVLGKADTMAEAVIP